MSQPHFQMNTQRKYRERTRRSHNLLVVVSSDKTPESFNVVERCLQPGKPWVHTISPGNNLVCARAKQFSVRKRKKCFIVLHALTMKCWHTGCNQTQSSRGFFFVSFVGSLWGNRGRISCDMDTYTPVLSVPTWRCTSVNHALCTNCDFLRVGWFIIYFSDRIPLSYVWSWAILLHLTRKIYYFGRAGMCLYILHD